MKKLYKEALLNLNLTRKIFYYTGCLKITYKKVHREIYADKINTYNIFSYSYRYYNPLLYIIYILCFFISILKNIIFGLDIGIIGIIENLREFIENEILIKDHIFYNIPYKDHSKNENVNTLDDV